VFGKEATGMRQRVVRWAAVAGLGAAVTGCGGRLPPALAPSRLHHQSILYVSLDGVRRKVSIYRMNEDGSRPRKLTVTEAFEFDPAWSPDRRQIAFAAVNDLKEGKSDLFVMNADGTRRRRLTHFPAGAMVGEPAWSPDGQQIVFTASSATAGSRWQASLSLYRVDQDGRHLVRLKDGHSPSWSPDGRQILFTRPVKPARGRRPGVGLWIMLTDGQISPGSHLWVMDPQGRNARLLTRREASAGVWSPDGRRIAYIGIGGRMRGGFSYVDLFVMNADGSRPQQLTFTSVTETAPQWSADGRRLLFSSSAYYGIPQGIYSVRSDGSNRQSLTDPNGFAWIRGGSSIFPRLMPLYGQYGPTRRPAHPDYEPMVKAIASGSLAPLRELLDRGADPNAMAGSGRSILMEAAQLGSPAMVRLLMERGANSSVRMQDGRAALWWAVNGHRPDNVQALLENGAFVDTRDGEGRTPLMLACDIEDAGMARLLLDRGANKNAGDRQGETVLHHAVASGSLPTVKLLLDEKAKLNAPGAYGQTALIRAVVGTTEVSGGKKSIVQALINAGVDPGVKDRSGRTALAWARGTSQTALVKLLEKAISSDPGAPPEGSRLRLQFLASLRGR
jgi:Tol biopolymer transport system component/ankyrin repeat protein